MVEKSRKAQITIFIILAVAIVVVLVLLFLNRGALKAVITPRPAVDQIQDCISERVENGLEKISVQGGKFNPENYYMYEGEKVEYLCYSENLYEQCIMQNPFVHLTIERELERYLEGKVKDCVDSVKESLDKKGYTVSNKNPETSVSLIPGNVLVQTNLDLSISKDITQSYKTIKTNINSELYDLVMITSSILNWEARYGDSETTIYMSYYPDIRVEKKKQGDGTTIYIITNKKTEDKFMFASRSVALTDKE